MEKEKMGMFKFFRGILGVIYKFYYNPKVIGVENIPKTGPIIVAGCHVHIMDQCNVIIQTKRPIHYMAKKEYFDGKFAWFFKAAGCIPVDRSKKDEHATTEALDVLKNGWALGIFPEGTRNDLKEERAHELHNKYFKTTDFTEFYNKTKNEKTSEVNYLEELYLNKKITKKDLINNIYEVDTYLKSLVKNKTITEDNYYDHIFLPFKYGAVSMSHKTNSLIVPFVITGHYKFRSKDLTIRIGKPLKIEDDLEQYNKHLREEMISLYKENTK